MCVNTEVNTFTRITQIQWLQDKLALSKAVLNEQVAYLAGTSHHTLKGLLQNPQIPIARPRMIKTLRQEKTSYRAVVSD